LAGPAKRFWRDAATRAGRGKEKVQQGTHAKTLLDFSGDEIFVSSAVGKSPI
jgi:hypothetical protein